MLFGYNTTNVSLILLFICRFWHVTPAGGNSYEVRNGYEAFRVDEHLRTCSCRMWQLSCLACPHAIAVLFKINKRPEDYVPACFRKDMYYQSYNQYESGLWHDLLARL